MTPRSLPLMSPRSPCPAGVRDAGRNPATGPTVALVSILDPTSAVSWSGTLAGMVRGFTAAGTRVVPIGPLRQPGGGALRLVAGARNRVRRDHYSFHGELPVLRSYARQVSIALDRVRPDLLVVAGYLPLAALAPRCPAVIWTDATVGALTGYYGGYDRWSPRLRATVARGERLAAGRATRFVAASQWAADAARRHYEVPEERLAVVPFGANLEPPPRPMQRGFPHRRPLRVLAVGVDWQRKGLGTAVAAVAAARGTGLDVRLDIVGCLPPDGAALPPFVAAAGHLDAGTPQGRRRLGEAYLAADAFLLPTRAECLGVVFCEAAAHGLPVIASDTGGVRSVVTHGVTGLLVPPASGPDGYADRLRELLGCPSSYEAMSRGAVARYERELNWRAAARRVLDLTLVAAGPPAAP